MSQPDWEQRLLKLEQQIAPLVAGATGKLSTRAVGALSAIAAGATYVIGSGLLPDKWALIASVIVGGLTAYITAEET